MNKIIKAALLALLLAPLVANAATPTYPDSTRPVTTYNNIELCQSLYTAAYWNHKQTLMDIYTEMANRRGQITVEECKAVVVMYKKLLGQTKAPLVATAPAAKKGFLRILLEELGKTKAGHQNPKKEMECRPSLGSRDDRNPDYKCTGDW